MLVLDDPVPGLASSFNTDPGLSPSTRVLQAPIRTSVLDEGKYYRYHFEGASAAGSSALLQQNKTYLLYKNTTPQLSTPISLISQADGIHVRFGLTRRVEQLMLQFPSGVSLKPKTAAAGGAASWTYEFVVPTDLQTAATSLDSTTLKGINASLDDATKAAGAPIPTGTLKLNIINLDLKSAPTIAQLELSVVRVNALPLINALKSQRDRLGLSKTEAQNVANQALGVNATSSQQDKDGANALVAILMQRGNNEFKRNLVTFLITTGKTVAKAYGVPVP